MTIHDEQWAELLGASYDGFQAVRKEVEKLNIQPSDIVLADDFIIAVKIAYRMYNPADKGKDGKSAEVMERVIRWQESGRKWARWGEFFARRSGRTDVGTRTEMKTGAGDWLSSFVHSDRESIIREYWKKDTIIRWTTEDFTIECTWHELFDYLSAYNDKGIDTWFKSNTKYNPMISKTVVMMQEYKTSKKKIAYLMNCPYCE